EAGGDLGGGEAVVPPIGLGVLAGISDKEGVEAQGAVVVDLDVGDSEAVVGEVSDGVGGDAVVPIPSGGGGAFIVVELLGEGGPGGAGEDAGGEGDERAGRTAGIPDSVDHD